MPLLPLVLVFVSGALLSVLGLTYKMAAARQCRPLVFTGVLLLTGGLISSVVVLFETTLWHDWRLWALGLAMGSMAYASMGIIVKANRLGPASVVWTLTNLAVVVPVFLSQLLLGDPFLRIDVLLMLLFVAMLLAMQSGVVGESVGAKAVPRRFWLFLAFIFITNGISLFCGKLKNTFFGDDCTAGLCVIFYLSGGLMALLTTLWHERTLRVSRAEWQVGILGGMASGCGVICMLYAMGLPAVVAFPLVQGTSLLGGIALTTIFYHEALTPGKAVGWGLGLGLMLLTVLREQANSLVAAFW